MLKYDLSGTHLSLRECQLLMYIYQHGQTGTSELAQVFKVTGIKQVVAVKNKFQIIYKVWMQLKNYYV